MVNTVLYALWGGLYLLCAALGVISGPQWLGICASYVFFLPPAALLIRAYRSGHRKTAVRIRRISLAWLALTLVLLVLNILAAAMSDLAGTVLYYLLAVLSAPLICGEYWLASLFLWACLLSASHSLCRKLRSSPC